MKKLLIFVDWYLPGYKAGGQIQSCANLAHALKDDFDIHIVTSDRDLGETVPYNGITPNTWVNSVYGYKIIYLSPGNRTYGVFKSIIRETGAACIYLNSMFSVHFTVIALAAAVSSQVKAKVVLAPRGMLHEGALQFKKLKKKFFLKVFRMLRLQKRIVFHATDAREAKDIKAVFGLSANTVFVNDFPAMLQQKLELTKKIQGTLNCIFVSRVSPKKNLLYLLDLLPQVTGNVHLTVIGPVEEEQYWRDCEKKIAELPPNCKATYKGAVPNAELAGYYRNNHLFVLATHGENFGHVIFESLINGRPVLISDQTPWTKLEEHQAGWSIPLLQPGAFVAALNMAVGWNQEDFNARASNAWTYAEDYIKNAELKQQYIEMFQNEYSRQQAVQ